MSQNSRRLWCGQDQPDLLVRLTGVAALFFGRLLWSFGYLTMLIVLLGPTDLRVHVSTQYPFYTSTQDGFRPQHLISSLNGIAWGWRIVPAKLNSSATRTVCRDCGRTTKLLWRAHRGGSNLSLILQYSAVQVCAHVLDISQQAMPYTALRVVVYDSTDSRRSQKHHSVLFFKYPVT